MIPAFLPDLPPRRQLAIAALLDRLFSEYNRRIVFVALFGSVARGDSVPDSDIDIVLVADHADGEFKWEARGIAARVSLEHDVLFNLHIYSQTRWSAMERQRTTLWRDVTREGIALTPELAGA